MDCCLRISRLILTIFLFWSLPAAAIESTDVLPEGINSLSLKWGYIQGLNQLYDGSGSLHYLGDVNSVEFDVATLVNINPQVQNLVNILNQFGHFQIGSNVHLGQLSVDAEPEINYFAPVFLRGVTPAWTVGVALPIVNYKNRFGIRHEGSNIELLKEELGGISPELDQAFADLDVSMRQEFAAQLAEKGYAPLSSRDETFIGDFTLLSVWVFDKNPDNATALRTFLTLPTGPEDDPHDLADLERFHQTSIENKLIHQMTLNHRVFAVGALGMIYVLPDEVERRVPIDNYDRLPGADRVARVRREVGSSYSAAIGGGLHFTDYLTGSAGYEYGRKQLDRYYGDLPGDYTLLGEESNRESHTLKAGVDYSAVNRYFQKKALFPWAISYEVATTLAGRNTENQTRHEIWYKMFF